MDDNDLLIALLLLQDAARDVQHLDHGWVLDLRTRRDDAERAVRKSLARIQMHIVASESALSRLRAYRNDTPAASRDERVVRAIEDITSAPLLTADDRRLLGVEG